jgi:hypothetical protein
LPRQIIADHARFSSGISVQAGTELFGKPESISPNVEKNARSDRQRGDGEKGKDQPGTQ